eukprot:363807-Chlamydomonas_euryale.AAC.9
MPVFDEASSGGLGCISPTLGLKYGILRKGCFWLLRKGVWTFCITKLWVSFTERHVRLVPFVGTSARAGEVCEPALKGIGQGLMTAASYMLPS